MSSDDSIDELIKTADDALYAAKHKGRDCVVLASANTRIDPDKN